MDFDKIQKNGACEKIDQEKMSHKYKSDNIISNILVIIINRPHFRVTCIKKNLKNFSPNYKFKIKEI
jgi:hypothetical protein